MPSTTDKIDLFKRHKAEYAAPKKPTIIETTSGRYLAAEGQGPPGESLFEARVGALYGMAYTIKFDCKSAGHDFVVCKLEGLYGSEDGADCGELAALSWKLMIRLPEFVDDEHLERARRSLHEKGKEGDFEAVTLDTLDEGPCVQMLHVGPYENEQTTIDAMMSFIAASELVPRGRHHEIYLSDPRRVPAEKLRTILRQPVGRAP